MLLCDVVGEAGAHGAEVWGGHENGGCDAAGFGDGGYVDG